jgi:hypothetical protein
MPDLEYILYMNKTTSFLKAKKLLNTVWQDNQRIYVWYGKSS